MTCRAARVAARRTLVVEPVTPPPWWRARPRPGRAGGQRGRHLASRGEVEPRRQGHGLVVEPRDQRQAGRHQRAVSKVRSADRARQASVPLVGVVVDILSSSANGPRLTRSVADIVGGVQVDRANSGRTDGGDREGVRVISADTTLIGRRCELRLQPASCSRPLTTAVRETHRPSPARRAGRGSAQGRRPRDQSRLRDGHAPVLDAAAGRTAALIRGPTAFAVSHRPDRGRCALGVRVITSDHRCEQQR